MTQRRPRRLGEKASAYAVSSAVFVAVCAVNVPSPLLPTYQRLYHVSDATLTGIFATFAVGVLAALVLLGALSDRIGRRPVLVLGECILVLSEVLFLFGHGAAWLFVARAVQGFALGTISSAASAALAELCRGNYGRAALMNTVAFAAAGTVSCLGTGLVAQYLPWRTTLCYAIMLAGNLASLAAVVRIQESLAVASSLRYRVRIPTIPRSIVKPVLVACGVMAVGWTLGGMFGSLSPSIVTLLVKGNAVILAGAVLSVFNLVGAIAEFLTSRQPPQRVMVLAVFATIIGALTVDFSLDEKSLGLFFVATVFAGLGAALVFSGSLALVNHISPPHKRAETVTAYSMSGYLALAMPTVALGFLVNHVGLQRATSVLVPILLTGAAISLVSLARVRTQTRGASSVDLAEASLPSLVE